MTVTTGADKPRSYNGDYMVDGKLAEEKVLEFLKRQPQVIGVDDWRDLRIVHEADVDCAIKTRDGVITLGEIKSDSHLGQSGNILFEILRINHTCQHERAGTLGWSLRSPATFFLYYAPAVKKLYVCRADSLRGVFQSYTRKARQNVKTIWVNTDEIKSTLSVLLPWEVCKDIFKVYDLA
jgi:hypothetical protein